MFEVAGDLESQYLVDYTLHQQLVRDFYYPGVSNLCRPWIRLSSWFDDNAKDWFGVL